VHGRIRVLIVEERSAVARWLLDAFDELLGSAQADIVRCADGAQALSLAAEYRPTFVVLDTDLERANAWHILTVLREREETANVGLLVVSFRARDLQQMATWLRGRGGEVLPLPCTQADFASAVQPLLVQTRDCAMGVA
jgi:DNA-binding response OmpR family regulator